MTIFSILYNVLFHLTIQNNIREQNIYKIIIWNHKNVLNVIFGDGTDDLFCTF